MYEWASQSCPQRASANHSGSGAQHLPAHSVVLRSSTKAQDPEQQTSSWRLQYPATPTVYPRTQKHAGCGGDTNPPERGKHCETERSTALISLILTSVSTEAMVPGRKLRPLLPLTSYLLIRNQKRHTLDWKLQRCFVTNKNSNFMRHWCVVTNFN